MAIKQVAFSELIQDYTLYPRTQVSSVTVAQLAEALEAGVTLPPIRVDAATMRVIDGFHRIEAHKKVGRETIAAHLETVVDEQDFFEKAVAANSAHGTRYTPYDQARVLARALELGMAKERVAAALHITSLRVEQIEGGFAKRGVTNEPLKRSIAPIMAGRQMTEAQVEANKKLSGMPVLFHVNQVLLFLDNDFIDWNDPIIPVRLRLLAKTIIEHVGEPTELAQAG